MRPTTRPFLPRSLAFLAAAALLMVAGGCVGRPEAPILELSSDSAANAMAARLDALLPTDVLLVGEQHDAAEHQQIERQVIANLAARGLLAAVALEMADIGVSTAKLQPSSTEEQTRRALKWDDKSWPWAAYGPVVMTAVRAGAPVLGANLPRAQMPDSMNDRQLDLRLPGPALKAQQQAIRIGHCKLLPESQITPLARVQVAKDITMAGAIQQSALPGKTVVLLAGNGHVDRKLGVPQHLRADLKAKSIRLRAGESTDTEKADSFDSVWTTPALPDTDYCAELKEQLSKPAQ